MRCPWCSNPEGLELHGSLIVDKTTVVDSLCPYGALCDGVRKTQICEKCTDRECVAARNRSTGIRLSCEDIENDELVALAVDSKAMFFKGGGVTLSGGEPTLQFSAVKDLLEKLKGNGINTAMETNGTSHLLEELIPLIDHLFIDFKIPDSAKHLALTGVPDDMIRKNICIAEKRHANLIVRTPLIAGINDSNEDIEAFLSFYHENSITRSGFEFLPYFDYGRVKWEQCGMEYCMNDDAHINKNTFDLFVERFKEKGLRVVKT